MIESTAEHMTATMLDNAAEGDRLKMSRLDRGVESVA
jgi:hypothetical protein